MPKLARGRVTTTLPKLADRLGRTTMPQLAQLEKDRLTTAQSAMMADTSATNRGQSSVSASPAGAPAPTPAGITPAQGLPDAASPVPRYGGVVGVPGVYGTGVAGYPIYPPAQIDTAGQREKQAFLAQPGATAASDYLQASLHDPISPYR